MHRLLSVALATAIVALPSCSNFTDCSTRRDCPSDIDSDSGASGASGKGGASAGTSGASGTGGTSGTSGEGGTDAAAGSGGAPPPPCDGSLGPDQDACVISDEYGVFVAPTGDDASADGTQAHPYATVTTALASIGKIKRVYVCAAEYAELGTLVVPDRVSIYGRFTCDGSWKYDADTPAYLHPASPIGATITDAKVGVLIQDVRLDAGNADDDAGASSFGLMIRGSQNVVLKRVEIRAGKGGKGKAGVDGATGPDGMASGADQNGKAGTCSSPPGTQMGATPVPRTCGSEGGAGGQARVALDYAASQDGGSGFLVSPSNGGKGGSVLGENAAVGAGGGNGMRGDTGAAAPALGTFSATGYAVASGGSGAVGKPGQGGGGGGASLGTATCIGATGGAGGMGGCGGDPGTGGIGGGASIALFSWQSGVSIDACTLSANSGGAGGDGGKGHVGGGGKTGGTGGPTDNAGTVGTGGRGGDGGKGGNGGNGAGGTGGPSIALVYDGTPVTQLAASTLNFAPGAAVGGTGGKLGLAANDGPDGSKGLTQDIYPKP